MVILILLGVIAASRGSDVLEQMPDVERAWLTRAPSLGWVHLATAVIAQFLVAFLLSSTWDGGRCLGPSTNSASKARTATTATCGCGCWPRLSC